MILNQKCNLKSTVKIFINKEINIYNNNKIKNILCLNSSSLRKLDKFLKYKNFNNSNKIRSNKIITFLINKTNNRTINKKEA